MADVFISYSKSDHALALKLSTFLESEGWIVWWDKSLGAADLYRDEIMKQLVAARAVITIWTENSVRSDWVRAEAGRAKAEGKLIPVKTPELTYADIPLPFGEMHTENIASTDLIRAAIVAQLAKPAVQQSPFWQITRTFQYQVLTWIGIMGSAITLFVNLNGVLDFADQARELVKNWHEWSQMFWGWAFSLVKIQVPRELVPIISFAAFATILVAGVNLSQRTKQQTDISYSGALTKKIGIFVGGVLLYLVWSIVIILVLGRPRKSFLRILASGAGTFNRLSNCLFVVRYKRAVIGIGQFAIVCRYWYLFASSTSSTTGSSLCGDAVRLSFASYSDLDVRARIVSDLVDGGYFVQPTAGIDATPSFRCVGSSHADRV